MELFSFKMVEYIQSFTSRIIFAAVVSLVITKRGYDKKSLSFSGALMALIVGFFTCLASYSFFVCLLTFFVTSSYFTKWKMERKRKVEENFKEGGQRNAKQVLCNGGIVTFLSMLYMIEVGWMERPINFAKDFTGSLLTTSIIGSLACCNGDTWASEIGSAIGTDMPRLITNLQKVPIGTNGAISFIGTVASAMGGLIIGVAYLITDAFLIEPSSFMKQYPPQWPVLVLATFAGIIGSMVDSYVGAVFQYSGFCSLRQKIVSKHAKHTTKHISGIDLLDNDQVNFVSCLFISILTPLTAYYTWEPIEHLYV